MRKLITLSAVLLFIWGCENEGPDVYVEAQFIVLRDVTECPGSVVIQRIQTGRKYFMSNLPERLQRAGTIFYAETLYLPYDNGGSPCLSQFNLEELKIVKLYE